MHMTRAPILIDPTIILLGLSRPRHHPYGRDGNASCETLWKSRRKKFDEQFSERLVLASIVRSNAWHPTALTDSEAKRRAGRFTKLVLLALMNRITPQFPFPEPNPFGNIPTSIHRHRPLIWTTGGVILCITGMGISL